MLRTQLKRTWAQKWQGILHFLCVAIRGFVVKIQLSRRTLCTIKSAVASWSQSFLVFPSSFIHMYQHVGAYRGQGNRGLEENQFGYCNTLATEGYHPSQSKLIVETAMNVILASSVPGNIGQILVCVKEPIILFSPA